jgi:hypothetical protein
MAGTLVGKEARRGSIGDAELRQAQSRQWQLLRARRWSVGGVRDDFGAQVAVWGQHSVVSREVEIGGRDKGCEAGQEREGIHRDGGGAVGPYSLEGIGDLVVGADMKAVRGNGGTGHVATQALEGLAVTTVDLGAGVDVEAVDLGEGKWGLF